MHVSGAYSIEYRATDGFGNQSTVSSVSWTQTILTPYLKVSAPTIPCDARSLSYYDLGDGTCASASGLDNFADLVNGESGRLRIGAWAVTNPHSIPLTIRTSGTETPLVSRRGLIHARPLHSTVIPPGWGGGSACGAWGYGDILEDGTCFTPPSTSESLGAESENDFFSRIEGDNERVLPPHSTTTIYALMDAPAWLDSSYFWEYENLPAMDILPPVAGRAGEIYRHCEQSVVVGGGPERACTQYSLRQSVRYLTRAMLEPATPTTTIEARSSSDVGWQVADNVDGQPSNANVAGSTRGTNTAEDGYTKLP